MQTEFPRGLSRALRGARTDASRSAPGCGGRRAAGVGVELTVVLLAVVLSLLVAGTPRPLHAQQEFVRQAIIVNTFEGDDARAARALTGALRGRIGRLHAKRELVVIGNDDVLDLVDGSGITLDKALPPQTLRTIARSLRADEMLSGTVGRAGNGYFAEARLVLVRDERLVQPLARVRAGNIDGLAAALAESLRRARLQLAPQRRCENAIRDGALPKAVAFAREGAAAAAEGVLARTCLLTALVQGAAPAGELLREAEAVLALSPMSYHALDAAARASDALGSRPQAAGYWLRLAATDTANVELQASVIGALLRGGNAERARPLAERVSEQNPDDMPLLKLRWQVLFTLRAWAPAVEVGAKLYERDDGSRADSTFVLRLATAMKAAGAPVRAVALAAEGTLRFPGDARLYAAYSQLVQGEAPQVVERGVERFPDATELLLLRAQELRKAGRNDEAVAPLQRAIALDPTLGQGHLQLAQSHADAGQHDSAYADIGRALSAGENSETVAQFALARGNALYRVANASKQRADFLTAIRFLSLSDSVRGSVQARFLLGASALAASQSAASDAPKANDCELSRLAGSLLPLAREKLTAGAEVAPDAARQYLTYLDQLEPVVARQLETLCTGQ